MFIKHMNQNLGLDIFKQNISLRKTFGHVKRNLTVNGTFSSEMIENMTFRSVKV